MHLLRVCCVLISAVAITSCARGQVELKEKGAEGVRATVRSEMSEVLPLVTAEHLGECRRQMEKTILFGDKYEAVGEAKPSALLSCLAQMSELDFLKGTLGKRLAMAAPVRQVGGLIKGDDTKAMGVCLFELHNGKITVKGGAGTLKVHRRHVCLNI